MQVFINGQKTIKEYAMAYLLINNPSCDPAELKAILDKACTKQGEHQRDLIIADGIEIILD